MTSKSAPISRSPKADPTSTNPAGGAGAADAACYDRQPGTIWADADVARYKAARQRQLQRGQSPTAAEEIAADATHRRFLEDHPPEAATPIRPAPPSRTVRH